MLEPVTKRKLFRWRRSVLALITVLTGAAAVSVPLVLTGTAQAADSNVLVVAVDMLIGGECDDGATMRINLKSATGSVSRACGNYYVDVDVHVTSDFGLGTCASEENPDVGLTAAVRISTGMYTINGFGVIEPSLEDSADTSVCARPGEFVPMDMNTVTGHFLVRYALR